MDTPAWATAEVLTEARHFCGWRILDHGEPKMEGICEESRAFALSEWITQHLQGEGWAHQCEVKGREVWWPLGERCLFCGERL